jgi:hypothetical protein
MDPLVTYRYASALLRTCRTAAERCGFAEILPSPLGCASDARAAVVLGRDAPPKITVSLFAPVTERVHARGASAYSLASDYCAEVAAAIALLPAAYCVAPVVGSESGEDHDELGDETRVCHELCAAFHASRDQAVDIADAFIRTVSDELARIAVTFPHENRSRAAALGALARLDHPRYDSHAPNALDVPAWTCVIDDEASRFAFYVPGLGDAVVNGRVTAGIATFRLHIERLLCFVLGAADVHDVTLAHGPVANCGRGLASVVLPLEPAPHNNIWHLD